MSLGHHIHFALKALEDAKDNYIKKENIEKVEDTIHACAITAAIAGVGSGWLPGAGAIVATSVWVATIWGMLQYMTIFQVPLFSTPVALAVTKARMKKTVACG